VNIGDETAELILDEIFDFTLEDGLVLEGSSFNVSKLIAFSIS
jgi:hypothetical protein